jgi:hypothetical protein
MSFLSFRGPAMEMLGTLGSNPDERVGLSVLFFL